jgi:putative transcriptional regulator
VRIFKNAWFERFMGKQNIRDAALRDAVHRAEQGLTTMTKQYRSDALASIHETMEALHEVGAIGNQTMRDFDDSCLTPVELLSPAAIRALREREHLSQPVFARYLNVSKNLVSDWERGVKRPGGPALRLLTVIEKKGIQAIA